MHVQIVSKKVAGLWFASVLLVAAEVLAGVGDPQVATDHPWYPGELAFSSFERLAATQANLYKLVTTQSATTDEQRVLAAWLWRNTHFWHGEQGTEDLWGANPEHRNDTDNATREYWTGLFAHGFGLCGTTHAQWTAEMETLLGHNRARVIGVTGHNSFEVFLTGGAYGQGRWALLDHDVSTVIYDAQGKRLLSIAEIMKNPGKWAQRQGSSEKQHGWLVSGLHPDDGRAFDSYRSAEYLAGYAGPPPVVHLRRGETLRRYVGPGLEDGRTFVFWGRNYLNDSTPGPERSRTWVNQPERMYRSTDGTSHQTGQARYANAVYTYAPDFGSHDYREGIVDESEEHVTFEFQSPYIIAATPANDEAWGVYQPGCRNGLVVTGKGNVPVSISIDRGRTWQAVGKLNDQIDLTDYAKGSRQYWLRFAAGARVLASSGLSMKTVCQANSSVIPRLKEHGSRIEFQASGRAIASAGPTLAQAETQRVAGAFNSPRVTLELAAPRAATVVAVYAAAHVASSNPPSPEVAYHIDYSTDQGKSWKVVVDDWRIVRQGEEPEDFWSQSFCWGSVELADQQQPVQVRFYNDGGKNYRRAEVHLLYRVPEQDATRVRFHWQDDSGNHTAFRDFAPTRSDLEHDTWILPTGADVKTLWVEYEPIPST